MEGVSLGRGLRLFCDMKKKFFFAFFLFCLAVQGLKAETNGYFSFDYSRGFNNSAAQTDTLHNLRLGLIFSGEFSPTIVYLAEMSLMEGRVEAQQAWISFFSSEGFRLKLGLFLVPFGKYNQQGRAHETFFIQIPLNVAYTFPSRWRDIGALAEGRIGTLVYALYIGNGLSEGIDLREGQQFRDNNDNKGMGGRLGWALSQSFEVAYSLYQGKVDAGNQRNSVLKCIDVTWNPREFQLLAEITRGDIENPDGFPKGRSEGYFIQASLPISKFYPVVSYQKLKYSDSFHGQGFMAPDFPGAGIQLDQFRWTFGLVFFPIPNVLLKLEYQLDQDKLTDQKSSALTLQAALSF